MCGRDRSEHCYQTAGSPALLGSVAAASEPPSAGPPSTSSIAWAWPSRPSNGLVGVTGWPSSAERLEHARREARLGADLDRRREMLGRLDEPARGGDRRRDVDAAVDEGRHDLGVDLGLGVAAHRAGHDPRAGLAGAEQHPRQQRVERPLAGREHVGVGRVEAEERAAVLVVDPGRRDRRRPTRSPCSSTR